MIKNYHSGIRLELAKKLCQLLINQYPNTILSFIVYGSVALGKAGKQSDIDIQVICDSPETLLNKKTEQTLIKIQKESGIKIVMNVKSPSYIIAELAQGDTFHVLMFLNGICLINGKVFSSLRSIVETKTLPSKTTVENKVYNEISNWSDDLMSNRLLQFMSDCSLSVFQYVAFKRVVANKFSTWAEQENIIQRSSNHSLAIDELLPNYAPCLNSFIELNRAINQISIGLKNKEEFNMIELLLSMRSIMKETSKSL